MRKTFTLVAVLALSLAAFSNYFPMVSRYNTPPLFTQIATDVELKGKVTGFGVLNGRPVIVVVSDDEEYYVLFPLALLRSVQSFVVEFGEDVKLYGKKLDLTKNVVVPLKIEYGEKEISLPYFGMFGARRYPSFGNPFERFGRKTTPGYRDWGWYGGSWMMHGKPHHPRFSPPRTFHNPGWNW